MSRERIGTAITRADGLRSVTLVQEDRSDRVMDKNRIVDYVEISRKETGNGTRKEDGRKIASCAVY